MTKETIVRNPDYTVEAVIWGRSGAWFYQTTGEGHNQATTRERKFNTKHAAIVAYTERRTS